MSYQIPANPANLLALDSPPTGPEAGQSLLSTAYAPASVGNFITGFDILGAALAPAEGGLFGDLVSVEAASRYELSVSGPYAGQLPPDPAGNLVWFSRQTFHQSLQEKGGVPVPVRMHLTKGLPAGSGLGSSATSIVAALYALNDFYGQPFARRELLLMAGQLESRCSGGIHYDNVAPALLGGLRLMAPGGEGRAEELPLPPQWRLVMYYPGVAVSTLEARRLLPVAYPLEKATAFAGRLAALVRALLAGDEEEASGLLRDELLEPHRSPLIPGFNVAREAARGAGACAFGISGSGPSMMAVCRHPATAAKVQAGLEEIAAKQPGAFVRTCVLDRRGARPCPNGV